MGAEGEPPGEYEQEGEWFLKDFRAVKDHLISTLYVC